MRHNCTENIYFFRNNKINGKKEVFQIFEIINPYFYSLIVTLIWYHFNDLLSSFGLRLYSVCFIRPL